MKLSAKKDLYSWAVIVFALALGLGSGRIPPRAVAQTTAEEMTIKTLTDPSMRAKSVQGNQESEKLLRDLAGMTKTSENQQQLFEISAKVFQELLAKTGGDIDRLQAIIADAQKNPETFGAGLSQDVRKQISELSAKISAAEKRVP